MVKRRLDASLVTGGELLEDAIREYLEKKAGDR